MAGYRSEKEHHSEGDKIVAAGVITSAERKQLQ